MSSAWVLLQGSIASSWHPGIPTNFDVAPAAITGFPFDPASATWVVDPWNYTERLGVYKTLLIASTPLHYDRGFGNPLWGLPLQFSWQHDTGRLLGGSGDVISPSSWWGGMNYLLSIIPFVGGLEAGVVAVPEGTRVRIADPTTMPGHLLQRADGSHGSAPHFCTSYVSCLATYPNATAAWLKFFQTVKHPDPGMNASSYVQLLWHAHVHSLHEGLPAMAPLLAALPSATERTFGTDWANLVDFVAALQFDVDYNRTNFLQGLIVPPRLLTDRDHAPWIGDFSGAENRALVIARLFSEASTASHGSLLELFKRACCSATGRADATAAMISLLEGKVVPAVEGLLKMVEDLARKCAP